MNVAIFGAGYVGLVTGACLARIGHDVTCVDIDPERVGAINAGKTPIYEASLDELLASVLAGGRFRATLDADAALASADISMIAVGTPPREGKIDLSFVQRVATTIGKHLRTRTTRHTVIVKSTVVPGTTGGLVRETIERESGRKAGVDFGLAMNPEFLREGCAVDDFMHPDRIVVGELDALSGDSALALYERFECPKMRTSLVNAELIKYASNTLLATLVSFSNELYALCEATEGADGEVVMDGLALDKRLSPVVRGERVRPPILAYLRGGIGYGGSCLPKDLAALRAHAEQHGIPTPLLGAVMQVNHDRAHAVVDMLERAVGGLEAKRIGVLGLAFKPDTDDLRDSPVLPLIEDLLGRNAKVTGFDPKAAAAAKAHFGARVTIAADPPSLFHGCDAVLLATSWPEFKTWDYEPLVASMRKRVIVDGRNALRHVRWPKGTAYIPVGRGWGNVL
jgi:UDPglucose 6-dehydrogenase/GDP-mannose 6-dehydrogenase